MLVVMVVVLLVVMVVLTVVLKAVLVAAKFDAADSDEGMDRDDSTEERRRSRVEGGSKGSFRGALGPGSGGESAEGEVGKGTWRSRREAAGGRNREVKFEGPEAESGRRGAGRRGGRLKRGSVRQGVHHDESRRYEGLRERFQGETKRVIRSRAR